MSGDGRLLSAHSVRWHSDPWYRAAWYVWPQITSLLIIGFLFSDVLLRAPPWAVPVPAPTYTPPVANGQLCRDALNDAATDWDPNPDYQPAIVEAKRRGLTVASCRNILGVRPSQPVPPGPAPGQINPNGNIAQQLSALTVTFLNQWYGVASGSNSEALRDADTIYADQVNYFGKVQTHQDVLTEWQNYMNRWPNRHFKMQDGTLTIDCDNLTWRCTAKGSLDFDHNSPTRKVRSWGSATFEYVLQFSYPSITPKIISENGTATDRHLEPYPPGETSASGSQLQQRTAEFLDALYRTASGSPADALAAASNYYPDQVNYFGKPYSRAQALADLRNYYEKWPIQQYTIKPGTVQIDCSDQTLTCTANGLLDFDARSPQRNARSWGVASFGYVLKFDSSAATPKIIKEAGDVKERHAESLSSPPLVPQIPGFPVPPGGSNTWNGCPTGWTVQGGLCKPYVGR